MMPTLFKPKRICCVCEVEASHNQRTRLIGEPIIIALSTVIYRRGAGSKGELKSAQRVQVCEDCLTRALTGNRLSWGVGDKGGWKLWAAIRSALLDRYSGMREADKS
jgi:hypothetical protein